MITDIKELIAVGSIVVSVVSAHFMARIAATKETSAVSKEVDKLKLAMQLVSSSLDTVEKLLERIEKSGEGTSKEVRSLVITLAELRVRISQLEKGSANGGTRTDTKDGK